MAAQGLDWIRTGPQKDWAGQGLSHTRTETGLRKDQYPEIAVLICQAGNLILKESTQHGRRWIMPSRLPDGVPSRACSAAPRWL